jgi:TerC family integral membrane protein
MIWIVFIATVVVALLVDFFAMNKQGAHRVSLKEAAIWSVLWVALSFLFVGWLWWYFGGLSSDLALRAVANAKALEFITGYLIEKALAVDNIFVFLLVFTYFAVPAEYQKKLLMFGILLAIAFRAVMIFIGSWLISEFHWVLYIFGIFLVYTGIKMWRSIGKEPDLESSTAVKWLRGNLKISSQLEGEKFFTHQNGVRVATPLFAAVLLVGIVDLLFAVDSRYLCGHHRSFYRAHFKCVCGSRAPRDVLPACGAARALPPALLRSRYHTRSYRCQNASHGYFPHPGYRVAHCYCCDPYRIDSAQPLHQTQGHYGQRVSV